MTHAPILSISGIIEAGPPTKGSWNVGVGNMIANANELRDLFLKYPHVRLA